MTTAGRSASRREIFWITFRQYDRAGSYKDAHLCGFECLLLRGVDTGRDYYLKDAYGFRYITSIRNRVVKAFDDVLADMTLHRARLLMSSILDNGEVNERDLKRWELTQEEAQREVAEALKAKMVETIEE